MVSGVGDASRLRAPGSIARVMLPGVVPVEEMSSHETTGFDTTEKASGEKGTVDCTVTVAGGGTADAPAARLKETDPVETIRLALGVDAITICPADVTDCAGDSESVIVMEKLEVPAAVGLPLSIPFLRVRPDGRVPLLVPIVSDDGRR